MVECVFPFAHARVSRVPEPAGCGGGTRGGRRVAQLHSRWTVEARPEVRPPKRTVSDGLAARSASECLGLSRTPWVHDHGDWLRAMVR